MNKSVSVHECNVVCFITRLCGILDCDWFFFYVVMDSFLSGNFEQIYKKDNKTISTCIFILWVM